MMVRARKQTDSEVTASAVADPSAKWRKAPSKSEIIRRQAAVAALLELRDQLSPLDSDPADLVRRIREEDELTYG